MPTNSSEQPIPLHKHPPTALDHSGVPVETSDPRSDEPLVNLADYGIAAHDYYARTDGMNPPYYGALPSASAHVWCRKSVATKLIQVNEALERRGLELFVLNSYRLLQVQSDLWAFFHRARESGAKSTDRSRLHNLCWQVLF